MAVQVKSYSELLGAMIRKVMAITGVNDMHKGSVILTMLEAAAQNDYEQMAALVQLLDDASVDFATGTDLVKVAHQFGLDDAPQPATNASGFIRVSDSSFTKVFTNVYVGSNPPIAGDLVLKVNSTTGFANGNQIYIGRGTNNAEGPFTIASVAPGAAFSTITLTAPLANNHNVNETVIKAQGGNRTVPRGSKVQIPASNSSPAVSFTTQVDAVLLDGEDHLDNILVQCDVPGTTGNAPLGYISQFSSIPFAGATVTNAAKFNNAKDVETDDALRQRIKDHVQGLSKGTPNSILSAILGLFDPDDNKRVVSASLVQPTKPGDYGQLFVDDGTGFEPSYAGTGEESLIDAAAGTETFFQLGNYPVIRAQVTSTKSQPFDFTTGGILTVKVNGIATTVALDSADFSVPSAATAIEVAEAINSKSAVISARTANGQSQVVIFPAGKEDESIQVVVGGANDILSFPTDEADTLKLYLNDVLLSKDGATARSETGDIDTWSGITDPSVLTVDVNGKPRLWIRVGTNSLEVSFNGASYVTLTDVESFLDLGVTINTASVAQWVTVLNQAISGAKFAADGDRLVLTSDILTSPDSKIHVIPVADGGGNLATAQGWDTTAQVGKASEYALNRFSGQIELASPLVANDKLSAGTALTRGSLLALDVDNDGNFNLAAGPGARPAAIYIVVDGTAVVRSVPLKPGVTQITTSNTAGDVWRYTDTAGTAATDKVFNNLVVGDYVVVARQAAANEGIFRVINVGGAGTWFEVENANGGVAVFNVLENIDIQAFSSTVVPQKVAFADNAGTLISSAAQQINDAITGATATAITTASSIGVMITTNRYASGGSIQVPVSVEWSATDRLDFSNASATNQAPSIAAVESASELGFPVDIGKGSITTNDAAAPFLTLTDSARNVGYPSPSDVSTPNQWVKYFNRTGSSHLPSNNNSVRMFVRGQDPGTPTVLTLRDNVYTALGSSRVVAPEVLAPLEVGDLYAQFYPFDFDQSDNLVLVVDGDEVEKTFNIPLVRNGQTTSASSTTFSGKDLDAATVTTFADSVWNTHDFADYKVWFRAHQVLNPTGSKNAICYHATTFGPNGNSIGIGYDYPTAPSQSVSTSVSTYSSEEVDVIVLVTFGSGAARTGAWTALTTFNITSFGSSVTYDWGNTGGGDVTPDFVASGVVVGDIATINSANFSPDNNGTFLITNVTPTSITILNNGSPVNEGPLALGIASALVIYPLAQNTAADVVAAVNNGPQSSAIIEAVLTTQDPFGTLNDGSGVIAKSSRDDAAINAVYASLVDGENWIDSFASPGPPSFTLKRQLTEQQVLDGGVIYDFGTAPNKDATVGEYFKLIPVHAKNVVDHLNKKSISGLSEVALIQRSNDAESVQIASLQVGSAGSIFVTGGYGNAITAAITKVAGIDVLSTRVTLPASTSYGFHRGQIVKLENRFGAKEINTYDYNTVVAVSTPGGTNPYKRMTLGDRPTLNVGASTFSVVANVDGTATYSRTAGVSDFSPAVVGDELKVSGTAFAAANRGTFLVTAVTPTVITVINPEATNEVGITPGATDMVAKTPFFYHPNLRADGTQPILVEKLNSRFTRFRYLGGGTKDPKFATRGIKPGFWVDVASGSSGGFDSRNVGRFRVVEVDDTSFVVENSAAIDDGPANLVDDPVGSGDFLGEIRTVVSGAGGLLQFWGPNSAMSSDQVSIEALPSPTWFPQPWQGRWTIEGHGRDSTSGDQFVYVSNSTTTLNPSITLGSNAASFLVLEGTPYSTYRTVNMVTPNYNDPTESLLWITGTDDADRFAAANGTQLIARNKLGFPIADQVGVDGYKYWTGLLQRVHRVMDGYDPDQVNFPGVKAAGVQIEALPPEIRRVAISVAVKPVTGLSTNTLSQTIKSAILGYIASLGVGDDVIISEIISRIQQIAGVQSVAMVYPSPTTERIVIHDNEKAIALESDITVT